jgi:hypothetical protein
MCETEPGDALMSALWKRLPSSSEPLSLVLVPSGVVGVNGVANKLPRWVVARFPFVSSSDIVSPTIMLQDGGRCQSSDSSLLDGSEFVPPL